MSDNYEHIFEQIAHVAAPYVIYYQESHTRGGLVIELNDEDRGRPEKSSKLLVKNDKIRTTTDLSGLFTRAVGHVKKKLQEELAKECDEPELRLWLAQTRDADFLDGSTIPQNLRKLYQAHLNPLPPKQRKIVKQKEEPVPVRTSRGVPVKEQKRKPHCPKHEDTEMVFHPEQGKWKCPVQGCRLVGRPPKEDSPVGTLMLGRGQLDCRVVYPEDGGEPSIIVIADNNVALDITSLVDMEKFKEFNPFHVAAAKAKRAGESVTTIDNRYASLLLRFPKPAKVFGCEHS